MTFNEMKKIIHDENLLNFNIFNEHPVREHEIVIERRELEYIVFTTDERLVHISEKSYNNESSAYSDFINRLRGDKEYRLLF